MAAFDLDDAYANGKYIVGAADYPPRWAGLAKAFRARMEAAGRADLDMEYGPHPRQKLDLFLPSAALRGLVVFVHGGYWRSFDKSSWSHLATGALAHDMAVAIPGYVLAPEARIREITHQVARAIDMVAGRIAGPIYLTGHSAGGHLVTRMLCADIDWSCCFSARLKRVVSISGLHDLRPLMQTEMNADLRLDKDEARSESPMLHDDVLPVPVVAWVGGDERPAFIDQARRLAATWPNAEMVIEPGKHHFNVIDGLVRPDSPLVRALVDQD